jgi:hypothetical protein
MDITHTITREVDGEVKAHNATLKDEDLNDSKENEK